MQMCPGRGLREYFMGRTRARRAQVGLAGAGMTEGAGRGAAGRVDGSAEKPNFNLASVGKGRGVRERRQVAGKDLAPIGDRGEEERAQTERGGEGHQRPGGSQSQRPRRWSQAPGTGGTQRRNRTLCPCPTSRPCTCCPISPQAHGVGRQGAETRTVTEDGTGREPQTESREQGR